MTKSKTEQRYAEAGLKKPAHNNPISAHIAHVDAETQPPTPDVTDGGGATDSPDQNQES